MRTQQLKYGHRYHIDLPGLGKCIGTVAEKPGSRKGAVAVDVGGRRFYPSVSAFLSPVECPGHAADTACESIPDGSCEACDAAEDAALSRVARPYNRPR